MILPCWLKCYCKLKSVKFGQPATTDRWCCLMTVDVVSIFLIYFIFCVVCFHFGYHFWKSCKIKTLPKHFCLLRILLDGVGPWLLSWSHVASKSLKAAIAFPISESVDWPFQCNYPFNLKKVCWDKCTVYTMCLGHYFETGCCWHNYYSLTILRRQKVFNMSQDAPDKMAWVFTQNLADFLHVQDLLLKCPNLAPWDKLMIFTTFSYYLIKIWTKTSYKDTITYN